jgi:hypothetical protein
LVRCGTIWNSNGINGDATSSLTSWELSSKITTGGIGKVVSTMEERWWASGHWQVKEGKTEEFIQQWREWPAERGRLRSSLVR